MNGTPYAFQSPVFAQKILQKSINSSKQNAADCDTIVVNPCNDFMSNISTTPNFHKAGISTLDNNLGLPKEQVRALIARSARRAYEAELASVRGKETLAKAEQYKIPFDLNNIDWLTLMDEVEEYELLLDKAEELNMDWDYRYYDPQGLEEAIEEYEYEESLAQRSLYKDFYATR